MDKPQLLPAIIVAVALIASSLILSSGMSRLGTNIRSAGVYSSKVELENRNNRALKIVLDGASELKLHSSQDPNHQ